jgi:hypothetical protein
VRGIAVRDPHAAHVRRLDRSRRRARRATVTAAALGGAAAVALPYAGLGLPDLAWAGAAAGAAAHGVLRWRDDRALRALPVPEAGAPVAAVVPVLAVALRARARFTSRGTGAAPLLRRLDRASRAMTLVVARMGSGAADTRREAHAAERALRAAAARLVAVERAAAVAPADARARLDAGAGTLRGGLADGVAAYERLVAAAGECLAADGAADGMVLRGLADATDALGGLAAGLAETARISARWGTPA